MSWGKCPYGDKGAHAIEVVYPTEGEAEPLKLLCTQCGVVRLLAVDKSDAPDDLTAKQIKALVARRSTTRRNTRRKKTDAASG